jgi:putative transposase
MLPDFPVHVVQRGNNRGACFFAEQDRSFYLHHLARLLVETACELHAYCLMTNHVHLLLTPKNADSCAALMKRIGQLHSQYVNRNYGRTGSLWEGRFRSCIVQSENYALSCYRYIELNPVRAGMTDDPAGYRWSSYRANAADERSDLITPHDEYLCLGADRSQRRAAYRALFGSLGESTQFEAIRGATQGNYVVGDKPFIAQMAAALGRRVQPGKAGRPAQAAVREDPRDLFTD